MTLQEHLDRARVRLSDAGIGPACAALDAELLAREVLGWDRARMIGAVAEPAPPGFDAAYLPLVERRVAREPIAYILGRREFWGLEFEVSAAVLVPRPETEFVVEEALRIVAARPGTVRRVADAGTGSGCLAVSLARALPGSHGVATDISRPALEVARLNARRHGVDTQLGFVQTDLLAGVAGGFDLIVSNPPYVPTASIAGLQPEVRRHEPVTALDGGGDGLDVVRRLLGQAAPRLRAGGWLIVEFGFSQEDGVRAALAAHDALVLHHVVRDLQGIPRTAVAGRRA